MRPVVYVPQPVHEAALERLRGEVSVAVGFGKQARSLADVAGSVHGILVRTASLTSNDIAMAPYLRVIARHGVGVDNIDVAAATERGISVCSTPDANTTAVAEHVFALILGVVRNVVVADRRVRDHEFGARDALVGEELAGSSLGVLGYGRIGAEVARIARDGFRMRTVVYDPGRDDDEIRRDGAEPASSLGALLAGAHTLSIHVPHTPETRGLIGAAELDMLPHGATVVHTARGGVLDEDALRGRLVTERLRGAGIDVFTAEPPPADHPLMALDNAVLTPHVAGQTRKSMRRMAIGAAEAILAVLRDESPPHVINPEANERRPSSRPSSADQTE